MKKMMVCLMSVFLAGSSLAEGNKGLFLTGIIFGGLTLGAYDVANRSEREANEYFDLSRKAITWEAYDGLVANGRTKQTKARRYKDIGSYFALVSASFLTAGAFRAAMTTDGVMIIRDIKFGGSTEK